MVKPAAKLQYWKQAKCVVSMTANQNTGDPCVPSVSYKAQTITVQARTHFWKDRNYFKKDITLDLGHEMTIC